MPLQPMLVRRCLGLLAALSLGASLLGAGPAFAGAAEGQSASKAWARFERAQPPTAAAPTPNQPGHPILRHELADFIGSVMDGQRGVVRGVYAADVLALRVVQQPAASFYVDLTPGTATQYGAASAYGVTGLLADNVASGTLFYGLTPGQELSLIYGDGAIRRYIVASLDRFQALSPTSPYSDFVNLATGARLSATELFTQMYSGGDKLTLQTCIAQDGVLSWGRLFVTALPAN